MSFSGNKQSHLLKQEIRLKFINNFIESVTNHLPYGISMILSTHTNDEKFINSFLKVLKNSN